VQKLLFANSDLLKHLLDVGLNGLQRSVDAGNYFGVVLKRKESFVISRQAFKDLQQLVAKERSHDLVADGIALLIHLRV